MRIIKKREPRHTPATAQPDRTRMARTSSTAFNPAAFLGQVGSGKTILHSRKHDVLFSQGNTGNAVFYIQEGRVKLTAVSAKGKEAIVAIVERTTFLGKAVWPGNRYAWPLPRPRTPRQLCALTKLP